MVKEVGFAIQFI